MREGCSRVLTARTLASDRRAMLPFLPTLATALVVALASLLCRPPALLDARPDATVEPARAGADGFHPAQNAAAQDRVPAFAAAQIVPAALAFGRLQPPSFVPEKAMKPAGTTGRPARLAAQATASSPSAAMVLRRPCSGTAAATPASRCLEARRGEPVRASVPPPVRPAPEPAAASNAAQPFPVTPEPSGPDEDPLPQDALPYASTAASWVDGVGRFGVSIGGSLGRGAAAVGGSVVELLASAR